MGQAANHCHTPPLALLPAYTPRPEKMQQDSDQVTVSLLRSGFVPFFQLRDTMNQPHALRRGTNLFKKTNQRAPSVNL